MGVVRQTVLGMEVRMRDEEIVKLKAKLSLVEAEAAKAPHLRSQVSALKSPDCSRAAEVNSLKERNSVLEED